MDELFARWRAIGDLFHQRGREERQRREQDQQENLRRKEAIIASANTLADDAARALEARTGLLTREDVRRRLDQLQQEWMAVGFVPMSEKERLWAGFREAMTRVRRVVDPPREAAPAAGTDGA